VDSQGDHIYKKVISCKKKSEPIRFAFRGMTVGLRMTSALRLRLPS